MRYFAVIFLISFIFPDVRSKLCEMSSSSTVTNAVIHSQQKMVEADPEEFLNNLQENLQEIRENLESGSLPENETVYFYLFTSKNPEEPYSLTKVNESLTNSPYDSKYPLIVILHGFLNELSLHEGTPYKTKKALLQKGNHNIIFVDYTGINQGAFLEAIKKSYIVAKELADLLQFLKNVANTSFEDMHLISTSLGCQIAGNTGHKLNGKIGRISAIDAAGDVFYSFPDDLKLDRDDAIFVDVIHTADDLAQFPKGLGYYYPIGHLDFYPNGGLYQPGCEDIPTNSSMSPELQVALHTVCMHIKASNYYLESMCNSTCSFIGVKCENYEDFEKGLCTESNSLTALMGYYATKPTEKLPKNEMFFLNTNGNYPYCKLNQP